MKKRQIFLVLLVLLVTLGIVYTYAAAAGVPTIEIVEFGYTRVRSTGGTQWIDTNEILHIRHRKDFGTIHGSLDGYAIVDFNCDMNLKTGGAREYGTMTIYQKKPVSGIARPQALWIGDWTHKVIDWVDVDGHMLANGVGPNDGRLMVITRVYRDVTQNPDVEIHLGYIRTIP